MSCGCRSRGVGAGVAWTLTILVNCVLDNLVGPLMSLKHLVPL